MQNIRFELAQDICSQILRTHGEQILIKGIYGLTVTGSNTPCSDILPALHADLRALFL